MTNRNNPDHFSLRKSGAGFTLIELLVVIAIIGLLASVVLVSLNGARLKARDTKRKADLKQLVTALELYYDSSGRYPVAGSWIFSYSQPGNWLSDSGNFNWSSAVMPKQPHDPQEVSVAPYNGGTSYAYYSDGTNYALVGALENTSDKDTLATTDQQWFTGSNLRGVYGWSGQAYVIIRR